MSLTAKTSLLLATSVCGLMLVIKSTNAVPEVDYAPLMGDDYWHMTGSPLRCGLSYVIPKYGVGYFEQYATQSPHFILRTWQQVTRALPAELVVQSPVWKPNGQRYRIARPYVKPGEYGIYLEREPTLKLLNFLSDGYQAHFKYTSEEGFPVRVSLSPVRFQSMYAKYRKCLGGLLSFTYEDVRETVFHFPSDGRELTDENKDQLRRIAQYVEADSQIETIRVVGYADESGRKGYNNAISEDRAKAVKNYLLYLGVPKRKLSVTWVGALKPIARNDTDDGRAANRRVVINLIKK